MRFVHSAIIVAGGLLPGVAWAQDCPQPYTSDQLLGDLAEVEFAAQGGEADTALAVAQRMERGLGCLEEKLVKMLVGRTYRSIAAGYMVGGNEEKGRGWFRTAIEVDPNFEFGLSEYAIDHPVRIAYDELRMQPEVDPVVIEGKTFVAGEHFLDGESIDVPQAVPGRPHLLQQVDGGVRSWLIDGTGFPTAVLKSAAPAVADAGDSDDGGKKDKKKKDKKKAKKDKQKDEDAPQVAATPLTPSDDGLIVRQRPPEKTSLLIAGGVILAGAGAMFGAAIASRNQFEQVTSSEDELRSAQQRTNLLYFGSIGVAAAGAGVLSWGILVDDGAYGPVIRGRF